MTLSNNWIIRCGRFVETAVTASQLSVLRPTRIISCFHIVISKYVLYHFGFLSSIPVSTSLLPVLSILLVGRWIVVGKRMRKWPHCTFQEIGICAKKHPASFATHERVITSKVSHVFPTSQPTKSIWPDRTEHEKCHPCRDSSPWPPSLQPKHASNYPAKILHLFGLWNKTKQANREQY